MSVMLICTLGNRDLQLSGEIIKPAREKGLEVFKNFESYYPELSYPIIEPIFRYIFDEERRDTIGRVVLVATDQGEDTDPRHRNNDTIEFARIIQRMIPKDWRSRVGQVKILKIPYGPMYLDTMYEFFGARLQTDKVFVKSDNMFDMTELEACYVEQTGGIPAANMALLYQCVNRFREKCCPLYVSEEHQVVPLSFVNKVLIERKKTILEELAQTYGYAAMTPHLDKTSPKERFIFKLSRYAQHRLYFDTLTARTVAREGMGEFLSDRDFFGKLLSELDQIEAGDHVRLILELFYNLNIKYNRHEFVDFLGRIYRFEEAVLRYVLETDLGVSTEKKDRTDSRPTLAEYIENHPDLKDFIKTQKTPEGQAVDPLIHGLPRFNACLNYLILEQGKSEYKVIYKTFQKFVQLINIRNSSIIGHGFKGVSEEIIKERYNGDVLEDLRTVVTVITEKSGMSVEDEPFERINRVLADRIRRI